MNTFRTTNTLMCFSMTRLLFVLLLTTCFNLSEGWSQLIVAHRGASHDAPENTLSAFRLAWEQGADGIEGDYYLTADQEIVCIHDGNTKRTTGVKKVVRQSTLSELQKLEYGGWKGSQWKGEPIPTFADVLETVPSGKTLVIELKAKEDIVPVLAKELAKHDTSDIQLLIIAFDQAVVRACKKQMPTIKVHWLTSFRKDDGEDHFHPTAQEIARVIQRTNADGVGFHGNRRVVDEAFIQDLQEGGCQEFHVWTVDSIEDAEFFQSQGAYGITTNIPRAIGNAIRRDPVLP